MNTLVLLLLAFQQDPTPQAVTDLVLDEAVELTSASLGLTWTAPVDMNGGGYKEAVDEYDLRYSTDESQLLADWAAATRVTPVLAGVWPQSNPSIEHATVTLAEPMLEGVTYYFAIKGSDGYSLAPISNRAQVYRYTPPAPAPAPSPTTPPSTSREEKSPCHHAADGKLAWIVALAMAAVLRR